MIPMIRFYEEYESKAEKRAAQRAAKPLKLRHPTGKARGFLMVERDENNRYELNGTGSVLNVEQGGKPNGLSCVSPSYPYLMEKCRAVGFNHMPKEWQRAFAHYINNAMADIEPSPLRRQYERLLRAAGVKPQPYKAPATA